MNRKYLLIVFALLVVTAATAQNRRNNSERDYLRVRWTSVATRMPSEWYGSDEAKRVAENVLISQREIGGWTKNQPYHHHFSDSVKAHFLRTKTEKGGTFDNGSTITELRFLAKVYAQLKDERYKEAFERGLNYIFISQYDNGGWPQFYPVRDFGDETATDKTVPYSMHITYNDNAMVNVMTFLKEIFTGNKDFAPLHLDETSKEKAKLAFDKGVGCILKTQIVVDNQPTVWCAQHHLETFAPVNARSYELASFSGAESVGITLLLMGIDNPSEGIIAAVKGAAKWFEENKIEGIREERSTNENGERDKKMIQDQKAPPIWARFYDLDTRKPFFCSRDGIKRYSLDEISYERRVGYSWYTYGPAEVLKKYPEWQKKWDLPVIALSAQGRRVIDLSGPGWTLWYDAMAEWENDEIHYDDPDVALLPVRIPTEGWEVLHSEESLSVNVPGTVEEYLQEIPGPEGAIDGVSWWRREIDMPDCRRGERVVLKFDAIRHRAEVFVNRKLAGYEIVGNSPFEVDITSYVQAGQTIELAVRITDPGGNYDWRDSSTFPWSGKRMPPSHAFGGITGNVTLEIQAPVAVTDHYMQNLPEITAVNAILEINNRTGQKVNHRIEITVTEHSNPFNIVFQTELNDQVIQPGMNSLPVYIEVPDAKKWDVENPNLYICHVTLKKDSKVVDKTQKRFGFRWFEASGVGTDAIYRLNGRRIVLRSAISWGFWPVNGIYPTDELARRQVMIARELGLNMLNFHRAIGNPNVMDYADELGLLIYEEPGGYKTGGNDPFTTYMLREKVLRMVKRDRSHPSLIIYNMMNETGDAEPEVLAIQMQDMRDMHRMDPSRIITRTSAWAKDNYVEDQSKIHLLPFDTTFYWKGWYDYHHAGGPATWSQQLYQSPSDYYNNTTNKTEIVMYGEEGAISSPPRLEKNKADLDKLKYKGWDGTAFLEWYEEFESFIDRKGLRRYYPTVDTLNVAMGRVSFEHQGRKIQMARMNNYTDAYVVNGWESELIENYSGIVDCFRYPKSTPEIIAKYNRPLYVAVMGRKQIVAAGDQVVFDFFLINEEDVKGEHTLTVTMHDPAGKEVQRITRPVRVSGGETYGELLAENIEFTTPPTGGMYTVNAELTNPENRKITGGTDKLLVIDLTDNTLAGKGAVWESGDMVRSFLSGKTQHPVKAYASDLEPIDWIIVTRPPTPDAFTLVPADVFTTSDGKAGAEITYYEDMNFAHFVHKERTNVVNHSVVEGATPHETVPTIEKYSMIWKGYITPPKSGAYTFDVQTFGRSPFSLSVDGNEILSGTAQGKNSDRDGSITLEAGKPVLFELKFSHNRGNSRCRLVWTVPTEEFPDVQKMMDRAKNDGTNIYILENTDSWSEIIAANSDVVFSEEFTVGATWLGGVMFNKEHPVFKGLPVNDVLNWPYQAVVRNGVDRTGFIVEGEELIVGAYHTYPMKLGTAMGIVTVGKGKILFSTLDIYDNVIDHTDSSGLVAKKLLLNMIDYN